jgi:hypothetical protein
MALTQIAYSLALLSLILFGVCFAACLVLGRREDPFFRALAHKAERLRPRSQRLSTHP